MKPLSQPLSPKGPAARPAFTLIEMLVVIAIIGILAAMLFPVGRAVTQVRIRNRAKTEMRGLANAIDAYKAKLGVYPPTVTGQPFYVNTLYYELVGSTMTNGNYQTPDGLTMKATDITNVFGANITGFLNCTTGAVGGEENATATKFLSNLRSEQFMLVTYTNVSLQFVALGATLPGPTTLPSAIQGANSSLNMNPWRYNSATPTNNPTTYDLWIDVLINGVTNRICNWSTVPLINVP